MSNGETTTGSWSSSNVAAEAVLIFLSSGTPDYFDVRAFGPTVLVGQLHVPSSLRDQFNLPGVSDAANLYTKAPTYRFSDDLDVEVAQVFLKIRDRDIEGEFSLLGYQFDARQNLFDVLSDISSRVTDQDLLDEAEAAMQRNKLSLDKDPETWAAELAEDLSKFTD